MEAATGETRLGLAHPMANLSDQLDDDVIPLALQGNRDAWDVLIARHERRVLLMLLARGVRIDRARDIVQETWTRLIARQRTGRLLRLELPGLALRQAVFLSIDAGRDARREAAIDDLDDAQFLSSPEASIEDRLVSRAQLERASAELDRCPETARRVFELVYDDPAVSHADAASRIGISVQRVRQTLCEVRARLRSALEEDRAPLAFARSQEVSDE